MKRKPKIKAEDINDESILFALSKIDEAVESLRKNEDDLVRVTEELMNRKLSDKDIDTIKSEYNSYSKSTKILNDLIGD